MVVFAADGKILFISLWGCPLGENFSSKLLDFIGQIACMSFFYDLASVTLGKFT